LPAWYVRSFRETLTRVGVDTADDSSGSTEGCDDLDEMDEDEDDEVVIADRGLTGYHHQQPQQTDSTGRCDSEVARLVNITRDCAVFMADFVQKIFDPS